MGVLNRLKPVFKWFFTKSGLITLALLIIILFFLLRACSSRHALHKEDFLIGRDSTWYPLQLYGRERSLQAFMNDLFWAIGNNKGIRFEWAETYAAALLERLDQGEYDAILSTLKPNQINEESYLFSELIFELGPVLIVRHDYEVRTLEQFEGKLIGMQTPSPLMFNAIREKGAHGFDFTLIAYPNINRGLDALVNNQVDAFILEAIPAYTLVEGLYKDKLKIATPPLTDDGLRLVALRGSAEKSELINLFNEGLNQVRSNGTYRTLIEKWDLINAATRFREQEQMDKGT